MIMKRTHSRIWRSATALSLLAAHHLAAQIEISTEAHKSAIVDVFCQDCVTEQNEILLTAPQTLPGINFFLSYISFDLNNLPRNARIAEASVSVFDANADVDDEFNVLALLDVESDWDEATLTYGSAVETYGARVVGQGNDLTVGVEADKVLWSGRALMDNEDAPGQATVGSTRAFQSEDPFTDQNFVDAQ